MARKPTPVTTPASTTPAPTPAPAPTPPPFEPAPGVELVEGSAEAFERHASAARALPADALIPLDVDPFLARHNALVGARAVQAEREAITALGLAVSWEAIESLDALGLALIWAVRRTQPVVPKALRAKLRRASRLRRKLMAAQHTLVLWGHADESEHRAILKGRGGTDTAGDLLALVAWFARQRTAIAGLHPVTQEALDEAQALGTELTRALRPAKAKAPAAPKAKPGDDMPDRLFTLLVKAYDAVERAAGVRWGREAAKRVPALRTRARAVKRTKTGAA